MVLWTPSPKPADVGGAEPSGSSAEKATNESLLAKDIDEKEFLILAMLAKALGNTFNEGTEDLLFGEIAHRKKKGAVTIVKDKNHKEQSYVHVPVTTTDKSFCKTRQFLDDILVINVRKDG